MLRIYICPKCFNYRMVSRKPDAVCLHCGTTLDQSELDYGAYINMTEKERTEYQNSFKARMMSYNAKRDSLT